MEAKSLAYPGAGTIPTTGDGTQSYIIPLGFIVCFSLLAMDRQYLEMDDAL